MSLRRTGDSIYDSQPRGIPVEHRALVAQAGNTGVFLTTWGGLTEAQLESKHSWMACYVLWSQYLQCSCRSATAFYRQRNWLGASGQTQVELERG